MSLFYPALLATFFLFVIIRSRFFRNSELSPAFLPLVFLLKIAAGLALWYIYTYYYTDRSTSDIWKYFDDSEIMFQAAKQSPLDYLKMVTGIADDSPHIIQGYYQKMNFWYQQFDSPFFNDGRTMIRLNALFRLISFGNYHVHTVLMCFLSLGGLQLIYRVLQKSHSGWGIATAGVVFLLPSVVFWGSGVLKESLLWLTLGSLLWSVFLSKNHIIIRFIIGGLSAWLIAVTRLYVLAALVPAFTGWWITRRFTWPVWKSTSLLLLVVVASMLLLRLWPSTDAIRLITIKRNDFINLARGGTYMYDSTRVLHLDAAHHDALIRVNDTLVRVRQGTPMRSWSITSDFMDTLHIASFNEKGTFKLISDLPRAGSLTSTTYLQPTFTSVLRITPKALFDILLRPLPHEARSITLLPAAIESVLLIVLFLFMLYARRRASDAPLAVFCIVFVLLLLAVTGLTTPVTGAAIRYKSIALPFLLMLLLMYANPNKLPRILQRLLRIKNIN